MAASRPGVAALVTGPGDAFRIRKRPLLGRLPRGQRPPGHAADARGARPAGLPRPAWAHRRGAGQAAASARRPRSMRATRRMWPIATGRFSGRRSRRRSSRPVVDRKNTPVTAVVQAHWLPNTPPAIVIDYERQDWSMINRSRPPPAAPTCPPLSPIRKTPIGSCARTRCSRANGRRRARHAKALAFTILIDQRDPFRRSSSSGCQRARFVLRRLSSGQRLRHQDRVRIQLT